MTIHEFGVLSGQTPQIPTFICYPESTSNADALSLARGAHMFIRPIMA